MWPFLSQKGRWKNAYVCISWLGQYGISTKYPDFVSTVMIAVLALFQSYMFSWCKNIWKIHIKTDGGLVTQNTGVI